MSEERLGGLAAWLPGQIARAEALGGLHRSFCAELQLLGLPLCRVAVLLEALHAEISGARVVWSRGDVGEPPVEQLHHDTGDMDTYRDSPLKIVDDTGAPFRARLDRAWPELPLLAELRAAGGTDYLIVPLTFSDRKRSAAVSYLCDRPGGFTEAEVRDLVTVTALISPLIEVRVMRWIATSLLETYLGAKAGADVFSGRVRRGDGGTMDAVIWYSDLRGFTALVETLPTRRLLHLINRYFDFVSDAAMARGGEVVQHVGDAVLIYFRIEPEVPAAVACARAFDGAEQALRQVANYNAGEVTPAGTRLQFGIGLDLGGVTHGNVGSRGRLSFNVVGPPVNRAARIESLTKAVGVPLLMSGSFAAQLEPSARARLASHGHHVLKGVDGTVELFGRRQDHRKAASAAAP
ncbi:MAG: hypothetical protein GC191_04805 [Azospirillum sp.]|nr:hypothetical protein [Azospirillum sp.]